MAQRAPAKHDGATLEPQDHGRLGTQQERVRALMADGRWWTLKQLAERVGASEAGVSARVRDLRKARFGGFEVERRRVGNGFEYRMTRGPEHVSSVLGRVMGDLATKVEG